MVSASLNYKCLLLISDIGIYHGIVRGGWAFEGVCKVFEYLISSHKTISEAGKALAGWENARSRVYPPRLVFYENLPEEEKMRFNNWMNMVIEIPVPSSRQSSLRILKA